MSSDLFGATGNKYQGKKRTNNDRLAAIPAMQELSKKFEKRCAEADGDVLACADLMAEAIDLKFKANQLEVVGRDGRSFNTFESMTAQHCMRMAMEAYHKARRKNQPPETDTE